MKFILGKKIGLTRTHRKGKVIPVTVIEAGPCFVTQIKTKKKDGYNAIQVGFGKAKRLTKPEKIHLKGLPSLKYLREFLVEKPEQYTRGQMIDVSVFSEGDKVKVTGISKGKGFAGVMKRWGFKGDRASHGVKHTMRAPGSIGSAWPQRVFKGMKMAGRMGGARITVRGLEVINVDKDKNLLALGGPVPGTRNSLVMVQEE